MDNRVKKVVILGGGTAGWMAASYLGKALQGTASITVLEAPGVPRIGVGEATIPNLQTAFFDFLGIPEDTWMRECNAAFKTGIKFVNWRTEGTPSPNPRVVDGTPDAFYHIFGVLPTHDQIPLSHYWFHNHRTGKTRETFVNSCFPEALAVDALRAPRFGDDRPATRYAWHFDANLVADFLRRFATGKQGVVHVADTMTEPIVDERGFVTALRTQGGQRLDGDLFIDCSGFRGLLINKAMGEPFVDMGDHLLCDSAIATNVPHDDDTDGIEPFTSSIAMDAGWTWKIPLLGRFGTGYVYSSEFSDPEQATADLCALWGLDPESQPVSKIRFRVGRNRRAWVRNVVSVGLSSCFVEPLESTGIYFITGSLYQLVRNFPDLRFDPVQIERFNTEIRTMFDDTRDFLQAHFHFSPRMDTEFWRANKKLRLSDQIKQKVADYRAGLIVNQPPVDEAAYYSNFEAEFRNFWTNDNYYCVLSGLGVLPDRPLPLLAHRPESIAGAAGRFDAVARQQAALLAELPANNAYLRQLHGAT
jgi:tryptophan halogenase